MDRGGRRGDGLGDEEISTLNVRGGRQEDSLGDEKMVLVRRTWMGAVNRNMVLAMRRWMMHITRCGR